MHYKITIFVACAPYPRLIYWIASSISQGKKYDMSSNPGPRHETVSSAHVRSWGLLYLETASVPESLLGVPEAENSTIMTNIKSSDLIYDVVLWGEIWNVNFFCSQPRHRASSKQTFPLSTTREIRSDHSQFTKKYCPR